METSIIDLGLGSLAYENNSKHLECQFESIGPVVFTKHQNQNECKIRYSDICM